MRKQKARRDSAPTKSRKVFGVNPDTAAFQTLGARTLRVKGVGRTVEGGIGQALGRVQGWVFGRPLATTEEIQERLPKTKALPVLASDNISSSAYATEELVRVLAIAGVGALTLTTPLTLAIIGVLFVVVVSYMQTVRAYPSGGGTYTVSRDNLGTLPSLVAAASLMIDYVLTVSVSIAAGVAALGSFVPGLHEYRVLVGLGAIGILVIGNLRGIRQSGNFFSLPTYLYLASIFSLLGYGLFRLATGTMPEYTPPPGWEPETVAPLTLMLVLRAFASGAVALTGTEAVADGVSIFKPPESRNAAITLLMMGTLFGAIFLGISFLVQHVGLVPDPAEDETLLSQLTRLVAGAGWYHVLIQTSTALLLILAANTAFVDFPRLSRVIARDDFMPRQFSYRSHRLAFSTGILALGALAALLIVLFSGSVSALIPLYTVGVFVAFTLSQTGMVLHWRHVRGKGWWLAMLSNGLGAVVTAVVALEVVAAKFTHGAWIVVILMPLLVLMMKAIHRHYRRTQQELTIDPAALSPAVIRPQTVLVPVSALNRSVARALAYARSLSSSIRAIHVTDDLEAATQLRMRWEQWVKDIPLVVIESPYRDWIGLLVHYAESLSQQEPEAPLTVVVPEFIPKRWWEHLLHSQSALRLKLALLSKPNITVVDIPYHLER
jgi:amino acid transporter